MAAAVQHNSLGTPRKTVYKTLGTSGHPTQYSNHDPYLNTSSLLWVVLVLVVVVVVSNSGVGQLPR